jgi:hypothetical protein
VRALLGGELAQAQSYTSDYHVKLEVQNGSGTWIDVGAALGRKWIVNASWGERVDTKVMQVTFTLWQEMGGNSLSPLMTASVLNRDDALAYAPLLHVGRLVRASVATMPHLTALDVAKYRPFLGDGARIDNVQQADSLDGVGPITIVCSDPGGWLMDMQIETSGIQYGTTPVGTPLETVIQNVLNANIPAGEPAVTLNKQSTSNFDVTDWQQGDTKVLDALNTLVLDSTGEDIRYRYDAAHVSRLIWFNPDRSRVTVDATFAPGYTMRQLDLALADVRNAGEMPYQGGMVSAVDTASAAPTMFRRRFFRLAPSSLITVEADAQKVLDAVVNDLSAPPGEAAADIPFFWPVQLWDRYTFQANGRQYDTDQTFAVMGYQHTIEHGRGSTTMTLTARIVGAFAEWLKRIVPAAPVENEMQNVQWTFTETTAVITFALGRGAAEVWAANRVIPAPGSDADFDPVVAALVPLGAGVFSYTVPRPIDGQVTLVVLQPYSAALIAGIARHLIITATPQPPLLTDDDIETATVGTEWIKLTERGIAVTAVLAQVQVETSQFAALAAPTRGPGDASLVKGGVLGDLEYEQDVALSAVKGRQTYIKFQWTLETGAQETSEYAFDADKIPNILSLELSQAIVKLVGDSDVQSWRVGDTSGAYVVTADGQHATFDLSLADPDGTAGLAANTYKTYAALAFNVPANEQVGGSTPWLAYTERVFVAYNGTGTGGVGGSPLATWAEALIEGPGGVGDTDTTIRLRVTSAPVGWTVKVFAKDPSSDAEFDATATLVPAAGVVPTVLTSYVYNSPYPRVDSSEWFAVTRNLSFRVELRDGSSVVQDSRVLNVNYYASSAT